MIAIAAIAVLGATLIAQPAVGRRATPAEQTLAIVTTDQRFELAVPVSGLALSIPRGGLEVVLEPSGGATANPRYFHLRDRARGLEISGWIEPARTYKGFDEFWDAEILARVKGGIAPPASWSVTKVERWEAALYDFGSSPASGNVRAEWVEDGSWIDLHISVASAQPIEAKRAAALEVLKAIGVRKSRSIGN